MHGPHAVFDFIPGWREGFWPVAPARQRFGQRRRKGAADARESRPTVSGIKGSGVRPPIPLDEPVRRPDIDLCRVKHFPQKPEVQNLFRQEAEGMRAIVARVVPQ